jgi:two-component system nitrate/nitrite response regulator NarL
MNMRFRLQPERRLMTIPCGPGPVLVVDDDAPFRTFVAEVLLQRGYEVAEAGNGADAIRAARAARPALVLLDVGLPDVSGYEVCHQLRQEFGERLPVIFVSGTRTEAADRVAGIMLGGDDYVVKPFDPGELLARVGRFIARADLGRDGSQTDELPSLSNLTPREQQILSLLANGSSTKAIAKELVISRKTVSTHVQRILAKLGVHSRAEAVAVAFRDGIATVDTTPSRPAASAVSTDRD